MCGAVKNGCKCGAQGYTMSFGKLEEASLPSPTSDNYLDSLANGN